MKLSKIEWVCYGIVVACIVAGWLIWQSRQAGPPPANNAGTPTTVAPAATPAGNRPTVEPEVQAYLDAYLSDGRRALETFESAMRAREQEMEQIFQDQAQMFYAQAFSALSIFYEQNKRNMDEHGAEDLRAEENDYTEMEADLENALLEMEMLLPADELPAGTAADNRDLMREARAALEGTDDEEAPQPGGSAGDEGGEEEQ